MAIAFLVAVGQTPDGAEPTLSVVPAVRGAAPLDAAVTTLREDLDRILRGAGLKTERAAVMVVSLDRSDTLYAHNADRPLVPASNLKLFTSATGLYYLGPAFRYNTYLLSTGPVRDGVLEGDLVLYGTGDPTLSSRFDDRILDSFADTLVALGIRRIRGGIIGDASFFEGSGIGDGWSESYSNAIYAAPASALSYNENIAILEVRPGAGTGAPAVARLVPGGEGIEIVNHVRTVASGRSSVRVRRVSYEGPLVLTGQVSRRTSALRWSVPVAEPAKFTASVLRELLIERGLEIEGGVHAIEDPAQSPIAGRSLFAPAFGAGARVRVLAIHTSAPLIDVLEIVNKKSNNFMAEQVLRTVGRVARGLGSVAGGAGAVGRFASDRLRIDTTTLAIHDGSGLSADNRTSARSVVHLLGYLSESPLWNPFWRTLPETGAADGLRRMLGTPAEGRLRAKTGTIHRVSALSGYVRTASGERLAFSILNNQANSAWRAKRVEDEIGARLARFERSSGLPDAEPVEQAAPGRTP